LKEKKTRQDPNGFFPLWRPSIKIAIIVNVEIHLASSVSPSRPRGDAFTVTSMNAARDNVIEAGHTECNYWHDLWVTMIHCIVLRGVTHWSPQPNHDPDFYGSFATISNKS
jgi:hypothetical protein